MSNILDIFPKLNVKCIGHSSSLQYLADIKANLHYLTTIIPLNRLPTKKGSTPLFLRYSAIKPFRDLCYNVQNEIAENKENGIFEKQEDKYSFLPEILEETIKLFNQWCGIMYFDMSFLKETDSEYILYNENWYLLIFEELKHLDRWLKIHYDIRSKAERERINTLQYIVDNEKGGLVFNFQNALKKKDDVLLMELESKILNFIKLHKSQFDSYPTIKDDLNKIKANLYFKKLNNQYEVFQDLKNEIESVVNENIDSSSKESIIQQVGRKKKRRSFIDLIINKHGYKDKYEIELRERFINKFKLYDGVELAKLAKSLNELEFFKSDFDSNSVELYKAFKSEFNNEESINERGFRSGMKEKEADKKILIELKEIGFDKLINLKL